MPPCSAKQPTYISSYKITDRSNSRKSQFKGGLHHYKEGDQIASKVRKQIEVVTGTLSPFPPFV